jgi:hypothetical protein
MIPPLWIRHSLRDKRTGSKKFLQKSTNGNGKAPIESNCRISNPSLQESMSVMSFLADFLEPRLVQSHTTVIIPLYKRVVFVRLLNCSEFASRLSKITQALYLIAGIQFRVGSRGLDERWSLGSVCVSRRSNV